MGHHNIAENLFTYNILHDNINNNRQMMLHQVIFLQVNSSSFEEDHVHEAKWMNSACLNNVNYVWIH
jgi:hypothetical protein